MDLPPQSARTHPEQDAAVPPPGDDIMSDAGGHPPSRSTCVRRQPARVLRPRAQKAPTRGSKKTSASLEGSLLRQRQEVGEHAGDENIDRLRAGRKRGMRHQEQQQRAARDPPRCSLSTSTSDTCPPAAAADMAESETPKVSIPSSPLVTIRPDTSAFEAAFECHARSLLVTEGASAVSSVTVGCASVRKQQSHLLRFFRFF
ncbi:hypothetical protein DFJ73DRAFT_815502 [Zopfochytrium polystomum]|nr:hypothetical protein DFJ73DRAFT_815502 [Zopfochytrium polystomum]